MNEKGFTLIELLVTLVLIAIISALALPAFENILKRQEVNGQLNTLVSMIYRARSEAVKRNQVVTICKSTDKEKCGGSWSDGWLMFVDKNADGARGSEEEILSSGEVNKGFELDLSAFGSTSYVRFMQNGLTSFHNGTFLVCPQDGDEVFARAVIFSKTARVRTSKDSNHDGIDEDSSGSNLTCH